MGTFDNAVVTVLGVLEDLDGRSHFRPGVEDIELRVENEASGAVVTANFAGRRLVRPALLATDARGAQRAELCDQ